MFRKLLNETFKNNENKPFEAQVIFAAGAGALSGACSPAGEDDDCLWLMRSVMMKGPDQARAERVLVDNFFDPDSPHIMIVAKPTPATELPRIVRPDFGG